MRSGDPLLVRLRRGAFPAFLLSLLVTALVTAPVAGALAAPRPGPSAVECPGGVWRVVLPAERGLDAALVARGVEELRELAGTESLLVARGGDLVVEETFQGAGTRRPHNIKSASKSLLSALVGIALAAGDLETLDQTVDELLPGALPEGAAPGKRAITLRHLLTMSSGLASTSGEAYGSWVASRSWVTAALARPLLSRPGSEFRYSTGNTHLISALLTRATGLSTLELARRELLEPTGMGIASWQRSPEGIYFGGNNLAMTPRDLARFGLLYLNGGSWGGRQVVPRSWVRRSTVARSEGWPDRYGAYGYLWWIRPEGEEEAYMAVGYGGQYCYVAPGADLVIVLTSTLAGKGAAWDRQVLRIFRERFVEAVIRQEAPGAAKPPPPCSRTPRAWRRPPPSR